MRIEKIAPRLVHDCCGQRNYSSKQAVQSDRRVVRAASISSFTLWHDSSACRRKAGRVDEVGKDSFG